MLVALLMACTGERRAACHAGSEALSTFRTRHVSVTVNRLRRKIEPDGANPVYIKNVFGQGYVFGE